MDKISKQILRELKSKETISFSFLDEPFSEIAPPASIAASLKYLESEEYIHRTEGDIYEISVSYRTLHPVGYLKKKILSYLWKNWIAIAALIISIVALLKQ